MMFRNLCHIFGLLMLLVSCEKPPAREEAILPAAQEGGIFMLNEGTFNNGNASLTFYDFKSKTLSDDVFYTANNRHVGDVLQSITLNEGTAYLVVNNSKKIEMIDATTFASKGVINGFNSPRYITMVAPDKAYVSDMYDNNIAVVDLASKTITKKIPCHGASEQMLKYYNRVFVCNTLHKAVYVVDALTDQITDSILVEYGPNSLLMDKNNKLWVLCSGDKNKGWIAGLFRIDPGNLVIEKAFRPIQAEGIFGASRLCSNGNKDRLYWLNGDVFTMAVSDTLLPAQPLVKADGKSFYGLGVDPGTGEIYVSDALDFVQRSITYHYSGQGWSRGFFRTGIITSGFHFYYK